MVNVLTTSSWCNKKEQQIFEIQRKNEKKLCGCFIRPRKAHPAKRARRNGVAEAYLRCPIRPICQTYEAAYRNLLVRNIAMSIVE